MIEIQNVTKVYGKQTVLSCVSATLEAGRIYGLVGINGSGKTTLMRCICGFTHPTSGKIIVNGDEIVRFFISCIGYSVYPYMPCYITL